MADFDGVINPAAAWADIPDLSVTAVARGGPSGAMNAQATAVAQRFAMLRSSTGPQYLGYSVALDGAVDTTLAQILGEKVCVKRFMTPAQIADVESGTAAIDVSAAVQKAYTECAKIGKTPTWGFGKFRLNSSVDLKKLPLLGLDRNLTTIISYVSAGVQTFTNLGQVSRNIRLTGPNNGVKPDGFATDGYARYIYDCLFQYLGDSICSSAIFVGSYIQRNEFLACESAVSDKLQDGSNSHTTLSFENNRILYGTTAFSMKTDAFGFNIRNNTGEDLATFYTGSGKQLTASYIGGNWIEQVSRNCTLMVNVQAGSINHYSMNVMRPQTFSITDSAKWTADQYANSGAGSGGGGGTSSDEKAFRVADFNGRGWIFSPTGIKPSAATASFATISDFVFETQSADANVAQRGGDIALKFGAGSYGARSGALRPLVDISGVLGDPLFRWTNGYLQNITLSPPASVTPVNNGDVTFELTSNTLLKIKVKGSDGVIRSASLTLA